MKKILILIITIIILIIGVCVFTNSNKKQWEVTILNESINVRRDAGPGFSLLEKVEKGEEFKVLNLLDTDSAYNWYLIEINRFNSGWIATPKDGKWILDINNPKGDIYPPRVKYYESEKEFFSEKNITYNHLDVKDENSYEISHKLYKDKEGNFWVTYEVTDKYENSKKITQKTLFEKEPINYEIIGEK